jgi:hypothetical protein
MGIRQDLENQTQQQVEAEAAAQEATAFEQFFARHPEYAGIEANRVVLRSYIGGDYPITLDLLEYAASSIGRQLARKSDDQLAKEEAKERAALIASIFEGVSLPRPTRIGREKAYELLELPALREVAEHRKREKALQRMNHEELRQQIRESNRPVEAPPAIVPYTRAQLLAMDSREMRKLLYYPNGQGRPGIRAEVDRILSGNK